MCCFVNRACTIGQEFGGKLMPLQVFLLSLFLEHIICKMELILYIILRGFAIGVLVSAPMGPVGVLCIQRTMNKGRWAGFYTGLGAAISDLLYSVLAGVGLSIVIDFIEANQNPLQIAGSIVLLVFAIYLLRRNPVRTLRKLKEKKNNYVQDLITGFLFTVSNPLILFLIIGLFARFNFMLPEYCLYHYMIGYVFIFIGAIAWWFVITLFVNAVRSHFNLRSMWLVNRIIGAIILIMSLVGLVMGIANYI